MRTPPLMLAVLVCAAPAILADEGPAPSRTASGNGSDAQTSAPAPADLTEHVQVTATRIPEGTDALPASLTVLTRDDLLRRGARDLTSALAQITGVSIASGGDGGPASSVPEFWGLREFDAFLLTVDGVPWGGAFAPSLQTLDLNSVDRIEVLRGAAPVVYGATSFVGVINVIRRTPGEGPLSAQVMGGSYNTGLVTFDAPLKAAGSLHSSIDGEASSRGFSDDRAGVDRGLVRWRATLPSGGGVWRFDVNGMQQRQSPVSPRPLDSQELSPLVPIDSNQNMTGAHMNDERYVTQADYAHPFGSGEWSTTVSAIQSHQSILHGFVVDLTAPSDNAHGFRQTISTTDIYLDSHIGLSPSPTMKVLFGVDHLHGDGYARGGDFDYTVALDGSADPSGTSLQNAADVKISDRREFSGLYGQVFWTPTSRWHVEAGVRANHTAESRDTFALDFAGGVADSGHDRLDNWRGGGTAGVTYTAWQEGPEDVRLFADYRNTYKPAVIDFGLDSSTAILAPETGQSYEGGVRTRLASGRVDLDVSLFQMDLNNIVVATQVGGLPALENSGVQRLRGVEMGLGVAIRPDLLWRVGYSLHDARFRQFVEDTGGGSQDFAGHRLEMSARDMASMGFSYGRSTGWQGWTQGNYVGSRFLDKENEAIAPAYVTWDAGVAYRLDKTWEIRLDGRNLNDQRPPISESELGEGSYYLLPARTLLLGLRWTGPS